MSVPIFIQYIQSPKVLPALLISHPCYRHYHAVGDTVGLERDWHIRIVFGSPDVEADVGWSYAKERLAKLHGANPLYFPLYLRKMESRYNNCDGNDRFLLLVILLLKLPSVAGTA